MEGMPWVTVMASSWPSIWNRPLCQNRQILPPGSQTEAGDHMMSSQSLPHTPSCKGVCWALQALPAALWRGE